MYRRKIKEDLDCGITVAMKIFAAKWKPCILDAISKGCHRPSEIHRAIPEAVPRALDMQLSELLELGIVRRETGTGFPLCTEYFLTDLGLTTLPVIQELDIWGSRHKEFFKQIMQQHASA